MTEGPADLFFHPGMFGLYPGNLFTFFLRKEFRLAVFNLLAEPDHSYNQQRQPYHKQQDAEDENADSKSVHLFSFFFQRKG